MKKIMDTICLLNMLWRDLERQWPILSPGLTACWSLSWISFQNHGQVHKSYSNQDWNTWKQNVKDKQTECIRNLSEAISRIFWLPVREKEEKKHESIVITSMKLTSGISGATQFLNLQFQLQIDFITHNAAFQSRLILKSSYLGLEPSSQVFDWEHCKDSKETYQCHTWGRTAVVSWSS